MSLNRINTKPKAISLAIPNEPSSGLSKWIDLFSDHSGNDGHNDHSSSGGANSFMRPLITALIILILGYLGYQMFSGDHEGDDHHGADTEQMKHDEAKQDASMNALEDGNSADHKPKENMHDNASTDKGEGHGDDGLATMDQKGLDFEIGSWAYTLSDWLANGTGSKTFALDKIPFEGGDDDAISVEGNKQLQNLAKILNAYPDVNAEVQGHTTAAKNAVGRTKKKATSKARAFWVQQKLKGMGVEGKKLSSKGYADENLLSGIAEDADGQKRITIRFDK